MAYFHCLIGGGSSGGGYELTVTCDAQFAGTTITCTDGVTTLTQTCPSASPYEVVFEIPNGGDWTISGIVSGQTVTTGVNIPTTATLEAIVHQSITLYSATEDTVTYTDIYGDTQTEVFASGQSSKQITVDVIASGSSITFTSGVAKDPSNLSNYYSKTVTITSNTTEVYLMPDNTLYWWGWKDNVEDAISDNGWIANRSYNVSWVLISPTYNTNNVSHTSSSNTAHVSGVVTKEKWDLSDYDYVKLLVDSSVQGIYLRTFSASNDFINGGDINATVASVAATDVQHTENISSLTAESYIGVQLGRQTGVGALKYLFLE